MKDSASIFVALSGDHENYILKFDEREAGFISMNIPSFSQPLYYISVKDDTNIMVSNSTNIWYHHTDENQII